MRELRSDCRCLLLADVHEDVAEYDAVQDGDSGAMMKAMITVVMMTQRCAEKNVETTRSACETGLD